MSSRIPEHAVDAIVQVRETDRAWQQAFDQLYAAAADDLRSSLRLLESARNNGICCRRDLVDLLIANHVAPKVVRRIAFAIS